MKLTDLVKRARRLKRDLGSIRSKTDGVVMFVDLANSTEYKVLHPSEEDWLARLGVFLDAVTKICSDHGRIVKYIGDEVMAFFEGPSAVFNATQAAERVLEFCAAYEADKFLVKIGLDCGEVSMLHFGSGSRATRDTGDPNGHVVDRCARIVSRTKPGAALCSSDFRKASPDKGRWVFAGAFKAKGIPGRTVVYQLRFRDVPITRITDEMGHDECLKELKLVQAQLAETRALGRRRGQE